MIPEGWREVGVRDVITDLKSGLSRKLSLSDIGLPVIRSTNINDRGLLDLSDIKYWHRDDPQGASTENYFLSDGDLLVNFINSIAQIGKCALYRGELSRDAIYTTNIFRVRVNNRILPEYFMFLTRTREYDHYIHRITKPAVNQASFTTKDFERFRFVLPPLPEQRKIAEILGTWDGAIALTERRIEAARQRKKGLMQRLLTGRVRFPEFEGEEWIQTRIGSFLTESRIPGTSGLYAQKLSVKLYGKGVFEKEEKRPGSSNTQYYSRRGGQFIYSKLDFLNGAFGIIPDELDGYESTLDLPTFEVSSTVDIVYFLNYVKREDFYKRFAGSALGGRKARRIPPSEFLAKRILLPSLKEQSKIAAVLQACDCKIELLTQKRDALQRQKKGLMQRLLTERVRVKV